MAEHENIKTFAENGLAEKRTQAYTNLFINPFSEAFMSHNALDEKNRFIWGQINLIIFWLGASVAKDL